MTKKSQELKEKIIKELETKSLVESQTLLGTHRDDFTNEDFQEVDKALNENIKRHINEWKIEEVTTFNGYYGGTFYGEKKKTMLLHQSAKLGSYDEEGFLNTEPWKFFCKEDYPVEQWKEIENNLNQQENPQNPVSNQQAQQEQPPKEIWYKNFLYRRVDDSKY